MRIVGVLYCLAVILQGVTFLVLAEPRLCQDAGNCELSGGGGASIAAMCSYFLALIVSCACIKEKVKPVCGIIMEKMRSKNQGGDDNDDDNDNTNADDNADDDDKQEASSEETDTKKSRIAPPQEPVPVEEEQKPHPVSIEVDDGTTTNNNKSDPTLKDVEEGRVAASPSPAASSSSNTNASEEERTAASPAAASQEDKDVEDYSVSETALLSSPFNFLDKLCCGIETTMSPTSTTPDGGGRRFQN
jgi:hypothetical protein